MKSIKDRFKKINSMYYGEILYSLNNRCKIGNLYFITAVKKFKRLEGLLDNDGNEIIPLQEMKLVEFFTNKSKTDYCLGFKHKDSDNLEYYHLKRKDNKLHVVVRTDYKKEPIIIDKTINNNFWIFRTLENELAVYNVEEGRVITNFFDEVSFVDPKESDKHVIYFCKHIYDDIIDEETNIKSRVNHTSICGFCDSEGNFTSPVLDTEAEELYGEFKIGGNSLSKDFVEFIQNINKKHLDKFFEKEAVTNDTIKYLFNNPTKEENKVKINTKIYEFKNGKKV